MTDNEIIKALGCCGRESCNGCPYRGNCHQGNPMIRDALDLINRQKAEIERLESNLKFVRGTVERMRKYDEERDIRLHAKLVETARAEAIKEFAERLISMCDKPHWCVRMSEIEDLAEEMIGDQKNER